MAETHRMPHGTYKKMLFRVPQDVLDYLEEQAEQNVRSVNAEWVYLLRQLKKHAHPDPRDFRADVVDDAMARTHV